jgi:hypothetical protein
MGHLRLVHSASAGGGTQRSTVDGIQVALFPDPNTVVLVRMDEETGAELSDLLQKLRPRVVVDLRAMPRFDFGCLNRSRMFRMFADLLIAYYDLGGGLGNPATVKRDHVADAVRTLLGKTAEGPMVLLMEADGDADVAFSLLDHDAVTRPTRWQILMQ